MNLYNYLLKVFLTNIILYFKDIYYTINFNIICNFSSFFLNYFIININIIQGFSSLP